MELTVGRVVFYMWMGIESLWLGRPPMPEQSLTAASIGGSDMNADVVSVHQKHLQEKHGMMPGVNLDIVVDFTDGAKMLIEQYSMWRNSSAGERAIAVDGYMLNDLGRFVSVLTRESNIARISFYKDAPFRAGKQFPRLGFSPISQAERAS